MISMRSAAVVRRREAAAARGQGTLEILRGEPRPRRRGPRRAPRRGPCRRRRERRRQIDADQDPGRRLSARIAGRFCSMGAEKRSALAARGARATASSPSTRSCRCARHLSTEENIFLGHFPMRLGAIDRGEIRRRTEALLERLSRRGRCRAARRRAQHRPAADGRDRQGALLRGALLILDEPTAVLDQDRVQTLFRVIGRLREQGWAIVYISHHLEEIFEIADRVTVLRDGKRTGSERGPRRRPGLACEQDDRARIPAAHAASAHLRPAARWR